MAVGALVECSKVFHMCSSRYTIIHFQWQSQVIQYSTSIYEYCTNNINVSLVNLFNIDY